MLIHFFWFFFHLKQKKPFYRTVCNTHPQNTRNNLYPKENRVLQQAWRHIQLDKCVGSLIRTEQCKHHHQHVYSSPGSGLSVCRGLRCQMEALYKVCTTAHSCLCCKQRSWSENGCFKNNEKCPLKLLSVLFARSRWTSVALHPILDYVLTNQHSADAYIICF